MARIELVLAHDPRLLLQTAAEAFLTPLRATPIAPFPTPPHLLTLRQGGLRDDLYRMAAEHGVAGWFDPPVCTFAELPVWLGSTGRKPLGEFERLALISSLLRRTAGPVLGRLKRPEAFADAVDRFFGELAGEGVGADQLEAAMGRVRGRDEFQLRRDGELVTLYRSYMDELARGGRRDGRDTRADAATALLEDASKLAERLAGRRELRVVGLLDLAGGWRTLLRALKASPALDRVAIYTSVALDLPPDLDAVVTRIDEAHSTATALFDEAAGPAGRATVIDAPDAEREMEEIARRVRALVDGGTAPARIAVVPRQARPGTDIALRAMSGFGLPVTARQRVAYSEVPVIRALLALFNAAGERWSRHAIVELAEQPYFGFGMDPDVLNHVGYRRKIEGLNSWAAALEDLERLALRREAEDDAEADDHRKSLPHSRRVDATRAGLAGLRAIAGAIDGQRTEAAWLNWLREIIDSDALQLIPRMHDVPAERFEIPRLDLAAWNGLTQIINEWGAAAEQWSAADERLDASAFAARLRDMLSAEVALWTGTAHGVQVVEALAAAFRSFDYIFITGMEAGRFPVSPPASPLLDAAEREDLAGAGLPLAWRRDWEAHERELFRVLVAGGTRGITVSHARTDRRDAETVRSSFVEALADACELIESPIPSSRMRSPDMPLCDDAARGHAQRVARIERIRETEQLSVYNGEIRSPALLEWIRAEFGEERIWSATQLESFAKCPWSYFSERMLRVEKLDDPDQELDPRVRGSVLHDALRRFYDAERDAARGQPVLLLSADRERAQAGIQSALDDALRDMESEAWLGHPSLRDVRRGELRRLLTRYIDFEIAENEKTFKANTTLGKTVRLGAWRHELAFEDLEVRAGGERLRMRGSIDRVDVSVDERAGDGYAAVIDYKSSEYAVPGKGKSAAWDDGVVLQLPLYAEALKQLLPDLQVARVEYRTLRSPKLAHSTALVKIDRKSGAVSENEDGTALVAEALDRVAGHLHELRNGSFPVKPARSCGCAPYCPARDICRIPGGPRDAE